MKRYFMIPGAIVLSLAVVITGLSTAAPSSNRIESNNLKGLILDQVKAEKVDSPVQALSLTGELIPFADQAALKSAEAGSRQGGETIETATPIPSMPYLDSGTTVGYLDDYQESAVGGISTSPDVVYSYTPSVNSIVNIDLCESSYMTNLWIYRTNEDTLVASTRFGCVSNPVRSILEGVIMDAGSTYYIVIDGDFSSSPSGDYVLNCTAEEIIPVPDSAFVHPALSDNGQGMLLLAYESKTDDTVLIWAGSEDDGASFPMAGSFGGDYEYPESDYWGWTYFFRGTVVTKTPGETGDTRLVEINHPMYTSEYGMRSWNWSQYGVANMKSASIACDSSQEFTYFPGDYRFGVISHVLTYQDAVDGPFFFYQLDTTISPYYCSITWFDGITGCLSTSAEMDKVTHYAYSVWDPYDDTESQRYLLIRRDDFANMEDEIIAGGWTYALDPGEHIRYPMVAANNGNIVVVSEYFTDADPDDIDIICWYASGSDAANLQTTTVIATTDSEQHPRLEHVGNDVYVCTFVRGDTLLQTVSEDAGLTWSTPEYVNTIPDDVVVNEFRTSDISEKGTRFVWEYRNYGDPDTSIFLHFAATGLIIDSDGDGVADEVDNCPEDYNPGQDDGDTDGVGNLCDNCPEVPNSDQTDSDGDGNGDACDLCEGFDDSLDEDSDGVPDGCDICAGHDDNVDTDGDTVPDGCDICPGHDDLVDFDDDTVPDSCDNCPETFNPWQEDGNGNGIGDACDYLCGDANGDDEISVADAVFLINTVFKGGPEPDPRCRGDANNDGDVSVADAVFLINNVFKGGPLPGDYCCP